METIALDRDPFHFPSPFLLFFFSSISDAWREYTGTNLASCFPFPPLPPFSDGHHHRLSVQHGDFLSLFLFFSPQTLQARRRASIGRRRRPLFFFLFLFLFLHRGLGWSCHTTAPRSPPSFFLLPLNQGLGQLVKVSCRCSRPAAVVYSFYFFFLFFFLSLFPPCNTRQQLFAFLANPQPRSPPPFVYGYTSIEDGFSRARQPRKRKDRRPPERPTCSPFPSFSLYFSFPIQRYGKNPVAANWGHQNKGPIRTFMLFFPLFFLPSLFLPPSRDQDRG